MKRLFWLQGVRGITLVEILVVLGLFSGVATLALGALFNTQTINNKLTENQSILDNINVSLQTITRDIRYGTDFYCSATLESATTTRKNCTGGGSVLNFRSTESSGQNDRVTYYLSDGLLYKRESPFGAAASNYPMTSSDVTITELNFYVDGALAAADLNLNSDGVSLDYLQPRIILLISGVSHPSRRSGEPATFSIETTISPRLLDTN